MWNNQGSGAPSFPGFPGTGGSGPGFPSPGSAPGFPGAPAPGFPGTPGTPGGGGYQPGYSPAYGPPAGAPGGFYSPLPGAPPSGYGPPAGYPPPPGPPPGHRGLPGVDWLKQQVSSGFPGQGQQQGGGYPGQGGGYPGQGGGYPGQGQQQGGYAGSPAYGPPGGQHPYQSHGPPPPPPTNVQHYGPQGAGSFRYSQCNGKKKALCIGINYIGQQGELGGCINDVINVKQFLCTYWGYKEHDIVTLTDDAPNPRQKPTKQNIIDGMRWLVAGAQPNDSLFFHFSGHGGQTKDLDGDEGDGYDEVIYPLDHQSAGHIVDDQMHDIMVKPLPSGCRLTCIFDSCHSGSALDLPYVYDTTGKVKEPNLALEAGQSIMQAVGSYARKDMGGLLKSAKSLVKTATGSTTKADKISKATRTSAADVVSFSGCKDSQTSADTQEGGEATGAMSFAFRTVLSANQKLSYQDLLVGVREILRGKYSQKPQLASSHPMDTNIMFIC